MTICCSVSQPSFHFSSSSFKSRLYQVILLPRKQIQPTMDSASPTTSLKPRLLPLHPHHNQQQVLPFPPATTCPIRDLTRRMESDKSQHRLQHERRRQGSNTRRHRSESTTTATHRQRKRRSHHHRYLRPGVESGPRILVGAQFLPTMLRWVVAASLTMAVVHGYSMGVSSSPVLTFPPSTVLPNHHPTSRTVSSVLCPLEFACETPQLFPSDFLLEPESLPSSFFELGPPVWSCPPLDMLALTSLRRGNTTAVTSSFFSSPPTISSRRSNKMSSVLSMTTISPSSSRAAGVSHRSLPSLGVGGSSSTMFLNSPRRRSHTSMTIPPAKMDHPSTFYRQQQAEQEDSQNRDNRQRGVLGFDVLASTSTSALSSTLPRRRSGSSNVNVNKWNDPTTTLFGGDGIDSHSLRWEQASSTSPTPLSLSSSRGGPSSSSFFFPPQSSTAAASSAVTEGTRSSRTNRQTVPYDVEGSTSTRDGTMEDIVLPAWFPDVPSKAQIETLKVTELMEACTHRGLKKVNNLLLARALLFANMGRVFLLKGDSILTQFFLCLITPLLPNI
jgi:hypothetical protein